MQIWLVDLNGRSGLVFLNFLHLRTDLNKVPKMLIPSQQKINLLSASRKSIQKFWPFFVCRALLDIWGQIWKLFFMCKKCCIVDPWLILKLWKHLWKSDNVGIFSKTLRSCESLSYNFSWQISFVIVKLELDDKTE